MRTVTLLFLSLNLFQSLIASPPEAVTGEVKVFKSGLFTAYILPVGLRNASDSEVRVAIRRLDPRDLAELSLLSKDGQQGGHIEDIQWSEHGLYLVFTTSSSSGHSPWNYRTYVFSTQRWQFICIDDVATPVVDKSIIFTDPTHVKLKMLRNNDSEVDDSIIKEVDLNALPWKNNHSE